MKNTIKYFALMMILAGSAATIKAEKVRLYNSSNADVYIALCRTKKFSGNAELKDDDAVNAKLLADQKRKLLPFKKGCWIDIENFSFGGTYDRTLWISKDAEAFRRALQQLFIDDTYVVVPNEIGGATAVVIYGNEGSYTISKKDSDIKEVKRFQPNTAKSIVGVVYRQPSLVSTTAKFNR